MNFIRTTVLVALAIGSSCSHEPRALLSFGESFELNSIEASPGMKVSAAGQGSLRLETGDTKEYRPHLVLRAPGGSWDLRGDDNVLIDVRSTGLNPLSVGCIAGNAGDTPLPTDYVDIPPDVVTEGARRLMPGESGVIRLPLLRERYAEGAIKVEGMRGAPPVMRVKDLGRVTHLTIFVERAIKDFVLEISNVRAAGTYEETNASGELESFYPMIDRFGQYSHGEWPGKTQSENDLAAARRDEEQELSANPGPPGRSRYGGWSAGPQLESTGFFRAVKHEGKWWLVDPDGRLFWSHGTCCVRPGDVTGITDREQLFAFLPEASSPLSRFYSTIPGRGYYRDHDTYRVFSFGLANLFRKYGEDWLQQTAEVAHRRLRSWGMNTMAAWSDRDYYNLRQTPYAATLGSGSRRIPGGVPDAFDPDFRTNVRRRIEAEKGKSVGDPWCIGFFVDNELGWGWDEFSLVLRVLESPPDQPAKRALADDLQSSYSAIQQLNAAWGTDYSSWNALVQRREAPPPERARPDLKSFYAKLANRYYRVIAEEVKRVAPTQLYLGSRFSSFTAAAVNAAAEHCDVVTYNRYYYTVADHRPPVGVDKPILVGEFHFGALDRGELHPGLRQTKDQDERAQTYRDFVLGAVKNPFIVGTHWFQYRDQETTGRADGENYQIGLVDICDRPYPEIIAVTREIGDRMYTIRSGGD
jgi:glycosyl hydrolase family 42 (putative beta-galactosidase)